MNISSNISKNNKKMKNLIYPLSLCALAAMASCSSNDNPRPEPDDPAGGRVHYDLFLTIGKHGGMNLGDGTIVRTVSSLEAGQPEIDIKGKGLEFRAGENTLSMEAIAKDGYYYQVPNSNDRFIKFKVSDHGIETIQEQPFASNYTYKVRSYTHAWLPGNTLLVMAANGKKDKVIWTKLNGDDLSIIGNGELDIPLTQGATTFTTSGIASYNKKSNTLFYFYYGKTSGSGMKAKRVGNFHVATIDPETMDIKTDNETKLAEEMSGSAYGELMQQIVTYDENGNLYIAAFSTENGEELGKILRINAGESDFDPAYNAFPDPEGKIHTIQYLGAGKALVYARVNSLGTKTDSHSRYYAVVDLNTGRRTRLACDGTELPYCSGGFSQRSAIADGKAYIGVTPENAAPSIYIYDIVSGTTTKGVDIAKGYYFDMLRVIEN